MVIIKVIEITMLNKFTIGIIKHIRFAQIPNASNKYNPTRTSSYKNQDN